MQKTTLLTIFALSCLSAAAGPVYSCGNGSYSSKPGPGCHRADLPTIGRYSAARPRPTPAPVPQRTASASSQQAAVYRAPAPQPVAAAASSSRTNSGRRMILEQELANERRALATAQRALTESRTMPKGDGAAYQAHQARVSSLQSDVLDRQQNIQALQRELSRM
ncbi:hypothetical protein A7P98_02625 [Eikenella sp. NML080894]|uniref:hypothetical protein n=1 Tax=unclassified Eikenella TaxID=2639367 RepID=UPI0007DF213B|nr:MULTISPECIES: hypothetical protein [unclassified Eikenella]OAM36856.1 hypothetical protein A7P98_02625 [Eikenella sp. NML080894]OAM39937.1 hypothetical protein A7P99_01690 [Eikenella sp. NML120348]OAM46072.1 hypothetical protein A7Q03_01965 [Eikenella sp. NML99-0057]